MLNSPHGPGKSRLCMLSCSPVLSCPLKITFTSPTPHPSLPLAIHVFSAQTCRSSQLSASVSPLQSFSTAQFQSTFVIVHRPKYCLQAIYHHSPHPCLIQTSPLRAYSHGHCPKSARIAKAHSRPMTPDTASVRALTRPLSKRRQILLSTRPMSLEKSSESSLILSTPILSLLPPAMPQSTSLLHGGMLCVNAIMSESTDLARQCGLCK